MSGLKVINQVILGKGVNDVENRKSSCDHNSEEQNKSWKIVIGNVAIGVVAFCQVLLSSPSPEKGQKSEQNVK